MKKNLLKIMPVMTLLAMGGALASCNNNGGNNSTEQEIALGSSVLGNWKYRTSEGKTRTKNNEEIEVYVDAETKFHLMKMLQLPLKHNLLLIKLHYQICTKAITNLKLLSTV